MKIMIVCSYAFYNQIPNIKIELEKMGYQVVLPNGYENPNFIVKSRYEEGFADWIANLRKASEETITKVDALLVLNYTKNGIDNYIGGSTFLEMHDAYRMNKKIFIMNDLPEKLLTEEIIGFKPILLKGNLSGLKENMK